MVDAPDNTPADSPKRIVVGIKVHFELNAKSGLRRVIFGLEKDTQGTNIQWKINFQLFERDNKTTPYSDPLVELDVEVDTALYSKADYAAHNGLNSAQAGHALGPAADDAKAAAAGEIDQADANDTVQNTLKK